jgi:queuine tRNA-ribosyltransferase
MRSSAFSYTLLCQDRSSAARRGVFETPHGAVALPAFMPVGTQGTVKGLTVDQVAATGAEMLLGNTYHLAIRPGAEVVQRLGGLHQFMGWPGPILTDSGGFQVFSLSEMNQVDDQAVVFRSHVDGRQLRLSPERAIEIQETLGSDVAMVLDHVVRLPSEASTVREACERSIRWAERCLTAGTRRDQAQFAIVQGGLDPQLRVWCAEKLVDIGFDGYAVGGLSVGEPPEQMYEMLDITCPVLPATRPRYLMGVGRPQDILQAVRRGVDLFDCVMPTRNGRNALAFTDAGPLRLRNRVHQDDRRPLEEHCPCVACRHSRGYLRHLFMAGEMLGPILLTAHNLTYYQRLMSGIRESLEQERFVDFYDAKMTGWQQAG